MPDKKPQRPGGEQPETLPAMRPEQARAQFRQLILANPNYFGNVKGSPFPPVLQILSDTGFEEIGCVGYQPELNRLEAEVNIKQASGYGGGVCTSGTPEYVRFYVSYDNGATWQDQGMNSFTAYDVPGPKPLEYVVSVTANLDSTWCLFETLPLIRAILSWNNPPPANTPSFQPVWGSVAEARIQLPTFQLLPLGEVFQKAHIEVPAQFKQAIDLSQPVSAAPPKKLTVGELNALYKDKKVPAHRYLFSEVTKLAAQPALTESVMTAGFKGVLADLPGVQIGSVIGSLLKTDGDTTFEQLDCIGLSNGTGALPDALAGILTVKLPNGYSGGLCSAGSQENVAFWVDWGDGAGYTYAGTASVTVHDIQSIPPQGLKYAVVLPIDLSCRRQPCGQGPKTAKVRAILAWEQLPPPGNPNFVPTWGNRKETTILINPGPVCNPNDHTPYLDTIGDMAVCDIDQTTGLATGGGVVAGFSANESPFGGLITITGFILNPPNVIAGAAPFKYKLYVRQGGGAWQPLSNAFTIHITEQAGGPVVQYDDTQSVDGSGYYTYREQIYPNQWRLVAGRVLGQWFTGAPMTGMWEVKIEALLPGPITLAGGVISCTDGTTRSSVKLYLDEVAPTPHVQITGFQRGGGPVQPAVNCGTFQKGDILHGTYSVTDEHFGALTLHVEPVAPAHGATVSPSVRSYPVVPTTGESGNWTLDTSPMDACGYIVRLEAADRTIVNSGFVGWSSSDSTGFCLVNP